MIYYQLILKKEEGGEQSMTANPEQEASMEQPQA